MPGGLRRNLLPGAPTDPIGIGNVEPQKHAPGADLGQPEEAKFRKQAWDLAPGAALILPLVFSSDKCPSRI